MTTRATKLTERAMRANPGGAQATRVPANTVRVFVDGLERLGYDMKSALEQIGVRRSDVADVDAYLSCAVLPEMLGTAMRQRPMKNLAARLAAETPIGAFPLVDYLVVTSDTVGAGLRQLARYLRLNEAPYALDPRADEDPIRVVFNRPLNAFTAEFGVSLTVLHLRKETQGELIITSVSFSHIPDDAAEIEQLLGCPISIHASWDGFLLPRESWEMPLRRRDSVLRSVLEQHAATFAAKEREKETVACEVGRVLASRMAEGETHIDVVARALARSARSLQRQLAAAGLSYQQVLDNTRREAAHEYLSNPTLSTGEVAYLLGYSEPAAFHRALSAGTEQHHGYFASN
jgi:AraC-like DNA-binding protein